MDSLSRVELQMALEEEFGIELADEDARGCRRSGTLRSRSRSGGSAPSA